MITNLDKLCCIQRELVYRKRIYARLVENGKMSVKLRDREITLMEAIEADYRKLVGPEPDLFNPIPG